MKLNTVICGDCLEVMRGMEDNSVDSIVTDPPYGISFMGKKWDYKIPSVELWRECLRVLKHGGYILCACGTRTQHRMAVNIEDAGFEIRDMIFYHYGSGFPKSLNIKKQLTKMLDNGNMVEYEDRNDKKLSSKQKAKYELRLVQKTDLSQTINSKNKQGKVLQSGLQEQDLQIQQFKSTKNVRKRQSCVEGRCNLQASQRELQRCKVCALSERISKDGEERWLCYGTPFSYGTTYWKNTPEDRSCTSYRPQSKQQLNSQSNAISHQPSPQEIRRTIKTHSGFGTALKPSTEIWTLCRKPLQKGLTVAKNVLKYGTGGINIDGCRVGTEDTRSKTSGAIKGSGWGTKGGAIAGSELGRFPANLILDGSDEVVGLFPDTKTGSTGGGTNKMGGVFGNGKPTTSEFRKGDSGNASRYFYCAKASKAERNKGLEGFDDKQTVGGGGGIGDYKDDVNSMSGKYGSEKAPSKNNHPTIKPISLMRYLCRLITPKGGAVLDCFTGSGSTGVACKLEGFDFIGIEREEEYVKIAEARIKAWKKESTQGVLNI